MGFRGQRAVAGAQFRDNLRIVRWRGDHRYVLPVFRPGTDHGGPADIDILDQLFERRVRFSRHLREVVQIHRHQVDGRDVVSLQRLHVFGAGTHCQNSSGDERMQGLHASIQHFRKLRDVGDFSQRRDARLFQHSESSACRKNFNVERGERLGEIDNTGFIGNAQQSALNVGHELPIVPWAKKRENRKHDQPLDGLGGSIGRDLKP